MSLPSDSSWSKPLPDSSAASSLFLASEAHTLFDVLPVALASLAKGLKGARHTGS